MKLDEVVDGASAFLRMERYVDEGTRSYSIFAARNEAAPPFQPRGEEPWFDLATVLAPQERVAVFQADPASCLQNLYLNRGGVLFPVHPQVWASQGVEYLDEIRALAGLEPIRVAPTASTRTVLTLAPPDGIPRHCIKLHFPHLISRFTRRLRRKNIQNSVTVTGELAHVNCEKFAYLPDVIGCTFTHEETAWGFLIREMTPRPVQQPRTLIPCFALFAADLHHPDDPPLIVQLIRRLGADPAAFVIEEIMLPVVQCWAKVACERGIILASHAQNTLLEIDSDFRPVRIVHRDFDVWIDPEARKRAGLDMPFIGTQLGENGLAIEQHYSLIYDRFIGHEFFDYLLAAIHRFFGVSETAVRERVREAFGRFFLNADLCLPTKTMFYYSNEPQPDGSFPLVDLQQPPQWR
jgi:siderophore synthetase component